MSKTLCVNLVALSDKSKDLFDIHYRCSCCTLAQEKRFGHGDGVIRPAIH
ncbi:MAG: hypothetical protein KME57_13560 [Scytonema hyalinum WJT4-NPBG1]|nr:hypothetical protein [Scytonema hyalinum WJT4-NPBG1]